MKRNSDTIGMPISKEDLNELLKETKETIALNCTLPTISNFGPVDLWNLQKKHRSALDIRRRKLN